MLDSDKNSNDNKVVIFCTTCRDGGQTDGINLNVEQKRIISKYGDDIGFDYIELGWPGANDTDTALFNDLPVLKQAKTVAFGMTHKYGKTPLSDISFRKVVENTAPVVCLVGKSWDKQVTIALQATLDQNLKMIQNSVAYAKNFGKEVVFDAEHFFDGYKRNPHYALDCLRTAYEAGADWLVLCDTNGGAMTWEIEEAVKAAVEALPQARFGIHCHNDCGLAIANTIAAVRAGCRMVQGTINGIGERCGNADLIVLLPILKLKLGYDIGVSYEKMRQLKSLSNELYKLLELEPNDNQPFVGDKAFKHKGGLHVSAVKKDPEFYEHIDPELVGNARSFPVSDQSGIASLLVKLQELGIKTNGDKETLQKLLEAVKRRKRKGYTYDGRNAAEASFAVLALRKLGLLPNSFTVKKFRTVIDAELGEDNVYKDEIRAFVDVQIGNNLIHKESKGLGPVHALDLALRKGLVNYFPALEHVELFDFKVKILTPDKATGATTHVTIVMKDLETEKRWTTVGVSKNIIVASLEALFDGYNYRLNML